MVVEGWGGGVDWEFGISRCKLLYMECINKVLHYGTENHSPYPVINHNRKEYEEERVYIHMYA